MSFLKLFLAPLVLIILGWTSSKLWQKRQRRLTKSLVPPIEPLHDFDWKTETPKPLRPFKPIYNITMAIQNENLSNLITIDMDYLNRVTTRRDIVSEYKNTVHGFVEGGQEAVRELYSFLLVYYLPVRFPTMFNISDKKTFKNLVTNKAFPTTAPEDPEVCLRILSETVEEDIFLLKETAETHVCPAFVCCFPTGFDPSNKLGQDLKGIHAPVPAYDKIGPSMERFFRKLEVGKIVRRMNWVVQTHGDLINTSGNHIKEGDQFVADEDVDHTQAHLRVELQSLTRLPKSKFVLFCFKTYLYPISEVKAEGNGPALADAIDGLQKGKAPGMFKYKSAVRWGKSVTEYLRS